MIGKKINQLATELAPTTTDLTIIGDPVTGVSKKITLEQLGAIFGGAVSFYTTLGDFPVTGVIDIIYCAKDTKKLYLWSGSAYVEVFPSQSLLDTYQLRSEKGVSNGYASLDVNGKVPIGQLPNSIMEYKGTWNAATNTPTLANGTGDTGDVYICSVAGTVNFGAGPITFAVGDYVVYSGTIWQRSSGAVGTVTSVSVSNSGDALAITGSPITTSGTINIGFAGTGAQYIKGDGTLATFPNTISQAEKLITEVYNSTGATLTKGTIVYINGGQGNLPTVTKALATGDSTSAQTFGVVQADITNNNNGYVVVAGKLSDLDTQAYTEGTQLYLSATTAGTWTSTKQYAPNHLVYVGIVVRAHPTQGIVEIKIQNGYELDELHDVAAQNPDNNDILQYKTSTSLWTKVAGTTSNIAEGSNLYYTDARSRAALSFTAGSGAYNSTTGVITIPTNTNQLTNGAAFITLASLSAGAGISYNNTTGVIASTITQYTDAMARASISLTTTGTSGAATYNSTTGVLNVPQYAPDLSGYVPTSRTLTINGTAYDLSANRSWSVGTVTSVGLSSATSGVTIGSTPVTTSGTITLAIATASGSQQGLLSSTDWTTFNNKQNALTNPVTGTGTTNYLPKFTGASTIGNSQIFDNGTSVGINTPSPLSKLDVRDASAVMGNYQTIQAFSTDSAGINLGAGISLGGFYSGTSLIAQFGSIVGRKENSTSGNYNGYLAFGTNNQATGVVERMRLDASGNLGLGVNPSAWRNLFTALQVGYTGSLYSTTVSTAGEQVNLASNYYQDSAGNELRIQAGFATRYQQASGEHRWSTAGSSTAGSGISFTQAMTLNASGNLSIGNTNDTYKLNVSGTAAVSSLIVGGASTLTGRVQGTEIGVTRDGADTIGDGPWFRWTNAATTRQMLTQLNASNGLTTWAYNGSAWSSIYTLTSTGAATFSSSVTTSGGGFVANMGSTNTEGLIIQRANTSSNAIIKFRNNTTDTWILGNRNTGDETFRLYNYNVGSDVLTVTNGGNVGIGTTSPFSTAKFQVKTTTNINLGFQTGTTDSTGFKLNAYNDDGSANIPFELNGSIMILKTLETERMRITSGGNVEINTGSIKTGEPDTGWGRAAIKIGASVSGAAFNVTRYLPVNVDGTVYFINLNSSTP